MLNLKMAWRNLWRNKRRTLITAASVFFAVILAIFMNSMQIGTWANMIDNVVGSYTGYAQIHKAGFWNDQTIDNSIEILTPDSIQDIPDNVEQLVPRLESFSWISSDTRARGGLVIGIDPDQEAAFTHLNEKVKQGRYFKANDRTVLVGTGMAELLKVGVGDTLVFLGQGYHGTNAVGKYPIIGLVKFGNPEMNKQVIFLPLKEAQWLYGAENRVTSIVLQLKSNSSYNATVKSIKRHLPEKFEVMGWKEMLPELVQAIQSDSGGMYIMLFVIYVVIGFGIFSTILMMTAERKHEFGVLLAIGMKRSRLIKTIFYESSMLSILGVLAGILIVLPVIIYFSNHPILLGGNMAEIYEDYGFEPMYSFTSRASLFISQALIIISINFVVLISPLYKLRKLKAVDAMRS
jgi:ABC-type lipoprotein release transport system permease subunit